MDQIGSQRRKMFSEYELKAFKRCLLGFIDILENKGYKSSINKAKAKAWSEITVMYNNIPGVKERNPKQLINFYQNLKQKEKKLATERVQFLIKTQESPKVYTSLNTCGERLLSVGAMQIPLITNFDNDEAKDISGTQPHENNCDREGSHEIIEVKGATADESNCLNGIDSSELSSLETPVMLIPEISNRETLQSCQRNQSAPSSTINPNDISNGIGSPVTKVNELRIGKKLLSTSDKLASSFCEVKKQILIEQHEWDWEKFNLEKEKCSMEKEKCHLEMKLMKEQIRMYELINEKIEKGDGLQISVNINK